MRIQLSIFVIAAISQVGATECGQVIRDPGFDLWCGDALCTWKVERGEVNRVATWHDGDSGIELVGPDVAIEQLTPVNSGDGTCIKFDLVANVESNAEVFLNVDVEGDGTNEMHERFPTSHWKPLSYTFAIKAPYDSVRFELTKAGAGKAVVAQIQAETRPAEECAGLSQLDAGARKNGARCTTAADCASADCEFSPTPVPGNPWFAMVCVGCVPGRTNTCGAGMTCGLGDAASPLLAVPMECVPTASHELGEQCAAAGECASGVCTDGACSTCSSNASCTGQTCGPSWVGGPSVCGGGAHTAPAGAACGSDDDCASAQCVGIERKECQDGRACSSPGSCPVETGLAPGACTAVGVQGGSCQ